MTGKGDDEGDKDDKAHAIVNHEDDDIEDKIWDAEDALEELARKGVAGTFG